jgi:hypothetical protein
MDEFIAKYQDHIQGVLCGFDRLVFRGHLRALSFAGGMNQYLASNRILLKNFAAHMTAVNQQLKTASLAEAAASERPVEYLALAQIDKEKRARAIAARDGVQQGLVCVFKTLEVCQSFQIHRNPQTRHLELQSCWRKCLFLYHYWMHPQLGFLHARIQTWFPFAIQVCLNGREWLARQMDRRGLEYARQDNCFPWVGDWKQAQELLERQRRTNWAPCLDRLARQLNPAHEQIFRKFQVHYYWSVYQSEWASDVVFRNPGFLRRLVPRLLHHDLTTLGSRQVMHFLGRRVNLSGAIPKKFAGQLRSDLRERQEGTRLKHTINGNSVKLYDKAYTPLGSVLRAETTVNNEADFRVYRPREGDPQGAKSWRLLRRGIADLYRRTEVSQCANERYLDALAAVDDDTTLEELLAGLQQPRLWKGRRVRALRPFQDDQVLLATVSRGAFTINGFRNRDLQAQFFPTPTDDDRERARRSAWVTRRLRLLRAHSLIRKISGTHRYQLTSAGRRAITAILTALHATVRQLTPTLAMAA